MKIEKSNTKKNSKAKSKKKTSLKQPNETKTVTVSKELLALESQEEKTDLFQTLINSKPLDFSTQLNITDKKEEFKTTAIQPPSALLDRLNSFLPLISKENDMLKDKNILEAKIMDINENTETQGQYIQLDLGLGVYDIKKEDTDKFVGCEEVELDGNVSDASGSSIEIAYTAPDAGDTLIKNLKINTLPNSSATSKIQLLD
ncbi:hypothetical protein BB561_004789 [Smittium simulii]|uniref:Uncharacterized protein n=1 Tax=Smittium simulii TaxID=133385 RepID=A0A2T9YEB1_9FUNG|nr:hypothetical protein BB561_004789 [Smittium simulii]